MQNQLGRNCPALELLSLGENPLTSISEYSGGLQKLFSLNLNITRIPDWSDLDKLREYPSLTELRIKHCPVLEEYTAHERRMMLVARLPNIQVIENELSNFEKKYSLTFKKLSFRFSMVVIVFLTMNGKMPKEPSSDFLWMRKTSPKDIMSW